MFENEETVNLVMPQLAGETDPVPASTNIIETSAIETTTPTGGSEAPLPVKVERSQQPSHNIVRTAARWLIRDRHPSRATSPAVETSTDVETVNNDFVSVFPTEVIKQMFNAAGLPIENYSYDAIQNKRQLALERIATLRAEDDSPQSTQRLAVTLLAEYIRILKSDFDSVILAAAPKLDSEFPVFSHQKEAAQLAFEYMFRVLSDKKSYNFKFLTPDKVRSLSNPSLDNDLILPEYYLVVRRDFTRGPYVDKFLAELMMNRQNQAETIQNLSNLLQDKDGQSDTP